MTTSRVCFAALALFLSTLFLSVAHAQTHNEPVTGAAVDDHYDVSNATKSPITCLITVTPTATQLSTLIVAAANCSNIVKAGAVNLPPWAQTMRIMPKSTSFPAIDIRGDSLASASMLANTSMPIGGWATLSEPISGLAVSTTPLPAPSPWNWWFQSDTGANVTVVIEIMG